MSRTPHKTTTETSLAQGASPLFAGRRTQLSWTCPGCRAINSVIVGAAELDAPVARECGECGMPVALTFAIAVRTAARARVVPAAAAGR